MFEAYRGATGRITRRAALGLLAAGTSSLLAACSGGA
jgi:hypothetical protein